MKAPCDSVGERDRRERQEKRRELEERRALPEESEQSRCGVGLDRPTAAVVLPVEEEWTLAEREDVTGHHADDRFVVVSVRIDREEKDEPVRERARANRQHEPILPPCRARVALGVSRASAGVRHRIRSEE